MFKRLLALQKPLTTHVISRGFGKPPRCEAHMNELPIPCMPWDRWYKEKQAYYNKILFLGIVLSSSAAILMVYTGSFYLNFWPPAQPGPPSDMVDECEDL